MFLSRSHPLSTGSEWFCCVRKFVGQQNNDTHCCSEVSHETILNIILTSILTILQFAYYIIPSINSRTHQHIYTRVMLILRFFPNLLVSVTFFKLPHYHLFFLLFIVHWIGRSIWKFSQVYKNKSKKKRITEKTRQNEKIIYLNRENPQKTNPILSNRLDNSNPTSLVKFLLNKSCLKIFVCICMLLEDSSKYLLYARNL